MSNLVDRAHKEEKDLKRWEQAGHTLEWGLASSIEREGGTLVGLAFRIDPDECLLTMKVHFEKRPMVAFISATDPARALNKAARELKAGKIKWKPDKWAQKRAEG